MKKELISKQYKRLRRHYEASYESADDISLLDLATVLRIWTEYENLLDQLAPNPKDSKIFYTASPPKKLLLELKECEYFIAYFEKNNLRSKHYDEEYLGEGPIRTSADGKLTFFINYRKIQEVGHLAALLVIGKGIKEHQSVLSKNCLKKVHYKDWMKSEIVRLQIFDLNLQKYINYQIPRNIFINRVANVLEGTHSNVKHNNFFDDAIIHINRMKFGKFPAPHFILLKVAQDILENVPLFIEDLT